MGLALLVAAAACSSSDDGNSAADEPTTSAETTTTAAASTFGEVSETYSDPASWLCRPDVNDDACDVDLDATLVHADGSTEPEPFTPAEDPPIDCFYVYPTISTDEGENSDLIPGDAERGIAINQAARFGEACKVYAPMYRQVPLGALFSRMDASTGGDSETTTTAPETADSPWNIAYGDVREAFKEYLAEDNDGRPFVLIGHSQGAGMLSRLVGEEIDDNDTLRPMMLSLMSIGGAVADSGDSAYDNIEACTSPTDTSCVISYSSFYAGEPPPQDSLFGHLREDSDGRAICTNPGDPSNPGAVPLQSYFQAAHTEGAPTVDTPFIHYDGLVTGECTADANFDWLTITDTSEGQPGWPADLGGRITPQWGAHLSDMNFALGDLINLVRSQSGS